MVVATSACAGGIIWGVDLELGDGEVFVRNFDAFQDSLPILCLEWQGKATVELQYIEVK